MRVFAVSDLHIDYEENRRWTFGLSQSEYKNDILVLAGDVTGETPLLADVFQFLKTCFAHVLYVPGNHELWVNRHNGIHSLAKFDLVRSIARDNGIGIEPAHFGLLSIVPLVGWYDYSFGPPGEELKSKWSDYRTCQWPHDLDERKITPYFISINEPFLSVKNRYIISFSHFLPRLDLMPSYIPPAHRYLYPVLGTHQLELQIRRLNSQIHIYGHSHVNNHTRKDNVTYINNAFGYPHEKWTTAKQLVPVFEM